MKKLSIFVIAIVGMGLMLVLSLGGSRNPHGDIDLACEACHTSTSWTEMRSDGSFDHDDTGFPLIGAHRQTACISCHKDLKFAETKDRCADCHSDIHRGKLGDQCQSCHTSESWENRRELFDQHAALGFTLTGVHAIADCNACHVNQLRDDFAGTPTECAGCHDDDFRSTDNPDHELAAFPLDCETCHSLAANTWRGARYDHPPEFRLEGGHAGLECIACHATQFAGTVNECFACHAGDFQSAPDPDHEQASFDHNCTVCHNSVAWSPATFNHDLTAFPLTGGHAGIECAKCHGNGYSNTSTDCFSCHGGDFAEADNPDHDANNFDHNCTGCHTTTAWEPSTFDHNQTDFALTGAHRSLDCVSCHAAGYANTAGDCYSCHSDNFAGVSDPNHAANNFSHDCTQCHTTSGWSPVNFDHANTGFLLTGGHAGLECASCHAGGYANTSSDCYSCHAQSFAGVTDPNHVTNGFPHECQQCHSTESWTPAEPRGFDHAVTGFLLTGAHATLACLNCHTSGYTDTSPLCYSCHAADFGAALDPNHAQNNFDHDCGTCHSTAAWEPSTFDHSQTEFALTGAHASLACISCHATGYTGTPTDCYSCHQGDFAAAVDPSHVDNNFDHDCSSCHTTGAWSPSSFDHAATAFPLTGAHASVNCISCHAIGYVSTPNDCFSCHQTDFNTVTEPNHALQNFDHDCLRCHTTTAWTPSSFDHGTTEFPLTGAHTSLQCIACHSSGYVNTATACIACHQQAYDSEVNPRHAQAGFDTECQTCHTTTTWNPANWDHASTGYSLTGAHVPLDCQSCHTLTYSGTATTCIGCHQTDFASANDPDHDTNNFDQNCLQCHNTTAWSPSTFNHATTGFLLTGGHAGLACITCHATGYSSTSSDCYSCHSGDFSSTTNPNHAQNNFDHNCVNCHNTTAWQPSTFNHATTAFPLTGAHTSLQCIACHASGYVSTPTACYDCHSGDFNSTTDPNHAQNNFDHNCVNCHNTTAWQPSTFNHATTGFPLTGAHTSLQCIACHASGYVTTPSACYDCHSGDFSSVTDPSHLQNNFSHVCTECHTTTAWSPASFDHSTTTFPLTGAHTSLQCIACHASGYVSTPSGCYDCHSGDFNSVTDPNHVQNNFSHVCTECHTTTAWSPASFDHSTTAFPLTGAHALLQCIACHSGGYVGTPTNCYSCHQTAYNSTTNPNHAAALFPTECQACHTTTAWTPANWNHDSQYFPIYSGKHKDKWDVCSDCHVNTANYAVFECIFCHEHNQTDMNNKHHEVSGYQYNSNACLNCHPDGNN
ncbi:MAG: hypothetical protein IT585_12575 [candidate division Zixibacteria bacterium]|nr:hypothetical protein [candidate division Zixibacteria bacterium]